MPPTPTPAPEDEHPEPLDPETQARLDAAIVAEAARSAPSPFSLIIGTVPNTWALGAAVVLLMAAGAWLFLQPATFSAPRGETLITTLPDGTTVELNSGARLAYARPFDWGSRSVRLTGEAFFDVVDGDKPFIVETYNATITVQGTRYNVRAWPSDPSPATTVVLEEGHVQVEALDMQTPPVSLTPGQMSRVADKNTPPSAPIMVSVEQILSWRQGGFFFDDHLVATILAEMERRFALTLQAPEPLAQQRLGLFLKRPETPEAALDTLCGFLDCAYRPTPEGYALFENNAE